MKYRLGERGSVLVEFTLLITTILLLLLGVFDFVFATRQAIALQAAAYSATHYAAVEGNGSDTAGMQRSALQAVSSSTGMTVIPTVYCSCLPGGSVVSCTSTCGSFDLPNQYVSVTTSASMSLLIPFSSLPASVSLQGSSTIRVK